MKLLYFLGVFCVVRGSVEEEKVTSPDIIEESLLDTFTLVKKHGYPCEIHKVRTEDGYILEVHRIPHGLRSPNDKKKPVVFLMHGIISSSADWVLMRPGKSLAYLLAESGYDVWMGNARGNVYSRNHVTLKTSSAAFWKFSWHEIGYYDLPAMIDYALKETNSTKLQYIGFSQGTTVFWVMLSMRPQYNDKVIAMQALAPVAFVTHVKSPLIKALAPFTNSAEQIFKLLGANEILPSGKINQIAGQELCLEEAATQVLCSNLVFLLCGFSIDQMNKTMVPVIMGHNPAGSSTRQLIHFGQVYNSGQFRRYDHGWLTNKRTYGSFTPPTYNLTSIRTPIFLHYGQNDWLATPQDVDKLFEKLPAAIGKFRVALGEFNHLDFMFAKDAYKLIYHRLLNIMNQFTSIY